VKSAAEPADAAICLLPGTTTLQNLEDDFRPENVKYESVVFENSDEWRATGFRYLSREAGLVISQSLIDYKPSDTYGRAILVGVVDTVWVSAWGVVLATIMGFARLSQNPLLALRTGRDHRAFHHLGQVANHVGLQAPAPPPAASRSRRLRQTVSRRRLSQLTTHQKICAALTSAPTIENSAIAVMPSFRTRAPIASEAVRRTTTMIS
jgi:hypothetical protein